MRIKSLNTQGESTEQDHLCKYFLVYQRRCSGEIIRWRHSQATIIKSAPCRIFNGRLLVDGSHLKRHKGCRWTHLFAQKFSCKQKSPKREGQRVNIRFEYGKNYYDYLFIYLISFDNGLPSLTVELAFLASALASFPSVPKPKFVLRQERKWFLPNIFLHQFPAVHRRFFFCLFVFFSL